jgi:hypothetical protein
MYVNDLLHCCHKVKTECLYDQIKFSGHILHEAYGAFKSNLSIFNKRGVISNGLSITSLAPYCSGSCSTSCLPDINMIGTHLLNLLISLHNSLPSASSSPRHTSTITRSGANDMNFLNADWKLCAISTS